MPARGSELSESARARARATERPAWPREAASISADQPPEARQSTAVPRSLPPPPPPPPPPTSSRTASGACGGGGGGRKGEGGVEDEEDEDEDEEENEDGRRRDFWQGIGVVLGSGSTL